MSAGEAIGADEEILPPPGFMHVLEAARRLAGVAVETPLLESDQLSHEAGRRVLVKAECLQHCGAFKFRGAWNHIRAVSAERARGGLLAISSGNHAQGVARAARLLGYDATIVMPSDAPATKQAGVRAYGAEIVAYDRASESRDEVAQRELERRPRHLVRPYDDPLVIAGQGTVGLEVARQTRAAGVEEAEVLVPCSGGGLATGVAIALEVEAPAMTVRTVEPEGFDDWARSLAAGQRLSNDRQTGSICDALLADAPGRITWAAGSKLFGPGLAVDDESALKAMALAWRHLRIVLEPGGAVALAAALRGGEGPVVVVASGGNADGETMAQAVALAA